jgi:hypothetical protein
VEEASVDIGRLFRTAAGADLGARLRAERPKPPGELVDEVVRKVDGGRSTSRPTVLSYSLAIAFTLVLLVPAAFLGSTSSGFKQAGPSTLDAIAASVGTYMPGQYICHWIPGNSSTVAEYNAGRGTPGNWESVFISDFAVYQAHVGHTYDYGPAPHLQSPGLCKNNAPAL